MVNVYNYCAVYIYCKIYTITVQLFHANSGTGENITKNPLKNVNYLFHFLDPLEQV